jgi:hypothetical protein
MKNSNVTTTVIADKITRSIWGGIWTDPKGSEAQKKLKNVIEETGNKNYEITLYQ